MERLDWRKGFGSREIFCCHSSTLSVVWRVLDDVHTCEVDCQFYSWQQLPRMLLIRKV